MTDFVTSFGRRQDALKKLFTEDELAPQRPLGNIDLIGSVLIDLHHRLAAMSEMQPTAAVEFDVAERFEAVRDIAEWEWSLAGPAVIQKMREKQAEASA